MEYKISQIKDSKLNLCTCSKLKYQVKWTGYEGTDEEYSWLNATTLHASDLLSTFHSQHPDKPGPLEKIPEQLRNLDLKKKT